MDKYQLLQKLLSQKSSNPYQTNLSTPEQFQFADWASKNNVPVDLSPKSDYDMSGYFKSMQTDPNVKPEVNQLDNQLHFTDKFKTPTHQTFSNESQYADSNAPHWQGNKLVNSDNSINALEIPNEVLKLKALQSIYNNSK